MNIKKPTTFEKQLELIRDKGFLIPEEQEQQCVEFLKRTNYYRFSAYLLPFRRNEGEYFPNVEFSRVQKIYEFDGLLRGLFFSVIEDIEIKLRTTFAYYVAHKYGAMGYLCEDMFSHKHNSEKYKCKIQACIDENDTTLVVKHHKSNYDGQFPIWVIVEFFSIGMISYFYKDMLTEDKKAIADELGTKPSLLESWLRCLTDLRNKCAHYSRLYYWLFSAMPKIPKELGIESGRKLFTQLIVLKYLYPVPEEWNMKFMVPLNTMIEQYGEYILLKHIGFPSNWYEILKR
ncbi:MAG: Abi family protein [Eubacteriales bacterium]